jgi:pSer/pThr/pTyr-binding forkhead associated (FHA) protein
MQELNGTGLVLYAAGPRFVVLRRINAGESVTIGRSRSADVFVDDPLVSRHHVTLRAIPVGDRFRICDMGSMNGTRLGEKKLEPNVDVEVGFGEAIRLGRTTLIVER